MKVLVKALKKPKVPLTMQARASIFTHQKFFSLKIVVHISVLVVSVSAKYLEPMLIRCTFRILGVANSAPKAGMA